MKKTILLTYAILGLAIVSIAQIDAAVRVGDSLYFFKGANCVTYSLITNNPVGNKKISEVWPSLGFDGNLSSVFMSNGKLIFTKGTTYVEWDIQKKQGGIPKVIDSNIFGFSNLDAAFEYPNSEKGGEGVEGKLYFFKSSVYSRSDLFDDEIDQANKPISDLKGLGWSSIDAALASNKTVYFFKGDEVAEINVAKQTAGSKSKIKDLFKLPASWFTSIPPSVSTNPPPETNKGNSSSDLSSNTTKSSVVKIGTQTWMSKDLNVTTYRNGDTIPQVKNANAWKGLTSGAWCYYDNNNPSKGILYNWYAVATKDHEGLAPIDWYIPTKAELTTLISNGISNVKSQFAPGEGGSRNSSDWQPTNYGFESNYWSSEPHPNPNTKSAWALSIDTATGSMDWENYDYNSGFSVRCIKRIVKKEKATTGWTSTSKDEFTNELIKNLSQEGYNYKQRNQISSCILSTVEKKYPDYNNLKLLPTTERQKMYKDEFPICSTYLKIPSAQMYIGNSNKIWMIDDLDVTKYRDGTPIKHIQNFNTWHQLTDGAFCYVDITDTSKGILYNWYAVNNKDNGGIAPVGWHVPNSVEWTLINANPTYAFNYFQGGLDYHTSGNNILNDGADRWWWISSEQIDWQSAWAEKGLKDANGYLTVRINPAKKYYGFRVRCIKD